MSEFHKRFLGHFVTVVIGLSLIWAVCLADCSTGNFYGGCNVAGGSLFNQVAAWYWGR